MQTGRVLRSGVRRAVSLLAFCVAAVSCLPVHAAETWPSQPYQPPSLFVRRPLWPGDVRAAGKDQFCVQPNWLYRRPSVMRGGLLASPEGALFFPHRASLDLFEGPLHASSQEVRFLPRGHPLIAMENISATSAGGRVYDELFGVGFARWPRSQADQFPDFAELNHDNRSLCPWARWFVHHPIRPVHQAFIRPS